MTSRRQKARSRSGPNRPEVIIRAEIQLREPLEIAVDEPRDRRDSRCGVNDLQGSVLLTTRMKAFFDWLIACRKTGRSRTSISKSLAEFQFEDTHELQTHCTLEVQASILLYFGISPADVARHWSTEVCSDSQRCSSCSFSHWEFKPLHCVAEFPLSYG